MFTSDVQKMWWVIQNQIMSTWRQFATYFLNPFWSIIMTWFFYNHGNYWNKKEFSISRKKHPSIFVIRIVSCMWDSYIFSYERFLHHNTSHSFHFVCDDSSYKYFLQQIIHHNYKHFILYNKLFTIPTFYTTNYSSDIMWTF